MNEHQLRDLVRRGHDVHSHSRTHPRLSSLPAPEMDAEIFGSKKDLEAILGRPVTQFSIPGGAYDDRVVEAARRAGYQAIFNSVEGYNDDGETFLRRRFTPRAYSDVAMLREICEHPARTRARIVTKRAVLGGVRGLLGTGGYGRLRSVLIRGATLLGSPMRRP
jgi:peptidoglycan/xylan/chitin deacetylase (PgdA/CDA1 family)